MKFVLVSLSFLFTLSVFADVQGKIADIIPYPFYEVQKEIDGKENKIKIIDSVTISLHAKLKLIKEAQKHIEVEYFIFGTDQPSFRKKLYTSLNEL